MAEGIRAEGIGLKMDLKVFQSFNYFVFMYVGSLSLLDLSKTIPGNPICTYNDDFLVFKLCRV